MANIDFMKELPMFFSNIYRNVITRGGSFIMGFLSLSDTPTTYTDQSLKLVRVNTGETALEFISPESGAAHNILSATHTDSVVGSAVAGDIIYGNATPKWTKLTVGSANQLLGVDSGLPAWKAQSYIDHTALTNLNSTSYTHLTSTNHTDLTDAGDSTLHYHAADRNRANHTGTQLSSTISDLETTVEGLTMNMTGSFFPRQVTDAGPMTATNGTEGEIVYNLSNDTFYGCTVTGTPATWAAFH